jgi:hypothetical protein
LDWRREFFNFEGEASMQWSHTYDAGTDTHTFTITCSDAETGGDGLTENGLNDQVDEVTGLKTDLAVTPRENKNHQFLVSLKCQGE